MSKDIQNIVLCSDGTGNKGGTGDETNVWRLYRGIDISRSTISNKQITYYDDGVGTQDFKYLKAISGGVGLGFSRNVREMYRFLVHTYDHAKDNRIYLFGFSRGAYTVRALAAFVAACGVIKLNRGETDESLDKQIKQLVNEYNKAVRKHSKLSEHQRRLRSVEVKSDVCCHNLDTIEFIGVWDTVSAVGVPHGFGFRRMLKYMFKFYFFDLDLNKKVRYARHALAIDDERKSFHPLVWNEGDETPPKEGQPPRIKQVWFAGVHSNVGGGYPKQGMSYEALDWMLDELAECGKTSQAPLRFEPGFKANVHDQADVFDKLYDSRSGASAFYRPKIRNIGLFARNSGVDTVKVHASAFRRIEQKGRAYHPVGLPTDLRLESVPPTPFCDQANDLQAERAAVSSGLTNAIQHRNTAHLILIYFTLSLVALVLSKAGINGYALLGCIVATLSGLWAVEKLAQMDTGKLRRLWYTLGFGGITAANWFVWSKTTEWSFEVPCLAEFSLDAAIIPGLVALIMVVVAVKQWRRKQAEFAHPPDSTRPYRYRRNSSLLWAAIFVFAIISAAANTDIDFGMRERLINGLMLGFDQIKDLLPDAIQSGTEKAIEAYPVLMWSALLGVGGAFMTMRWYRSKIYRLQEASWDVVRNAPPQPILHQFAASHFNEKARWAMAFKGIQHERQTYLPGPHLWKIKKLSGQTATPVMQIGQRVIVGSAAIIERLEHDHAEPPLYPTDSQARDKALKLQQDFDANLGPAVRTVVFSILVNEGRYLRRLFAGQSSKAARVGYAIMLPVLKPLIAKANGVTPENTERCRQTIRQLLDAISLQVSGGYLVGGSFTVADLTAAALLAPLANVKHPDMKRPEPIPERMQAMLSEFADHPTIHWVNEIYTKHRQHDDQSAK